MVEMAIMSIVMIIVFVSLSQFAVFAFSRLKVRLDLRREYGALAMEAVSSATEDLPNRAETDDDALLYGINSFSGDFSGFPVSRLPRGEAEMSNRIMESDELALLHHEQRKYLKLDSAFFRYVYDKPNVLIREKIVLPAMSGILTGTN